MTGLFQWCMKHGAKVLFAVALLQVLAALFGWLWSLGETGRQWIGSGYYPMQGNLLTQFATVMFALNGALLPFFGALLIDRLDRWLGVKGKEAAE
jgi:hypothetical protein